ncbi:MAG: hypothetical protein IKC64_02195 [Clostridia bacterium]|nr:hypothetical protein [Clostridia bacterium]
MKNSFILTTDICLIKSGREVGVTEFTVATDAVEIFENEVGVTAYKTVKNTGDSQGYTHLFLPTLEIDQILDEVIDATYNGAKLIVSANYSLDEIGAVYNRYKLSPVQVLHKFGLLDKCVVVGGVHLDRDDIDLMAQSGAKLVLCPTASAGYGYGSAHYVSYRKKLDISLGSGDNRFNRSGNMLTEAQTLYLFATCDMRDKNALTEKECLNLIGASDELSLF